MFARSTIIAETSLLVLVDNSAANMMKDVVPLAALALFLGSVAASPVRTAEPVITAPPVVTTQDPDIVTIGHWTGALTVSVPAHKRAAEPEPGYDLSAWSGSHHVAIEGRKYDLSAYQGATEVSVERSEAGQV